MGSRTTHLAIAGGLVVASVGLAGMAMAGTGTGSTIHGCVNRVTGQLRVSDECRRTENPITWNTRGPAGPRGATGATGAPGPVGPAGPSSLGVTLREETVSLTIAPDGNASVVAYCDSGEVAISGGITAWGGGLVMLTGFAGPTWDGVHPSGWRQELVNHTGQSQVATVTMSALCVPGSMSAEGPAS